MITDLVLLQRKKKKKDKKKKSKKSKHRSFLGIAVEGFM